MGLVLGLLGGVPARIWAIGLGVLAVLAAVAGIRHSGKLAERAAQASVNAKVKDDQLKAAARRPRTRDDLADRMRDGSF